MFLTIIRNLMELFFSSLFLINEEEIMYAFPNIFTYFILILLLLNCSNMRDDNVFFYLGIFRFELVFIKKKFLFM